MAWAAELSISLPEERYPCHRRGPETLAIGPKIRDVACAASDGGSPLWYTHERICKCNPMQAAHRVHQVNRIGGGQFVEADLPLPNLSFLQQLGASGARQEPTLDGGRKKAAAEIHHHIRDRRFGDLIHLGEHEPF